VDSTPLTHYQGLIDSGRFSPDDNQLTVIRALDSLWHDLQHRQAPSLIGRLRGKAAPPARGLYLWGTVGRGKTWLMDLFYERLAIRRKQRIHFHRFMQRIHHNLKEAGNARDPLPRIADAWSRDCRVLCLDEFFVSDIADAMLLAGLLEALFNRGVTLVTTSNVKPDDLYRDGLQRSLFLPAIDLIKQNTQVLELGGSTDFRLRILEQSRIYLCPADDEAERQMQANFERISADCEMDRDLEINGRSFHARRRGDGIVWFDFRELCDKPRGSNDYIEIARSFNTVMLSHVPQMHRKDANAVRRFIIMVDEFYDRNVKLLISAEKPIHELYTGNQLGFEFQRTASRLTEMQSTDYLARPHLP
jgi:cell division protein ZapE